MRLEALEAEVGDVLRVEWRAFLLRPFPENRPLDRFRAYTQRWERPAATEPAAEFHVWGDARPPSHSMPCAVAGKVAATFGDDAFDRFHLALMHAYFAENRTVSDRAVILDVAAASGLDAAEFASRLDNDGATAEEAVIADHRDALARGIAAVPTVVVNDEYVLQGAMPLDAYRRVVARLTSGS